MTQFPATHAVYSTYANLDFADMETLLFVSSPKSQLNWLLVKISLRRVHNLVSKISLISCFFRRVLSPLQRLRPQTMMSLREWEAELKCSATGKPVKISGTLLAVDHSSQVALTLTLVSFKHVHCFYLMRTHVTHTLGHTFPFHSCVSRARTLHASALSPLVSSYGVCQLATMGFFTLMKGSARNVCTFFNVQ